MDSGLVLGRWRSGRLGYQIVEEKHTKVLAVAPACVWALVRWRLNLHSTQRLAAHTDGAQMDSGKSARRRLRKSSQAQGRLC